METPCPDSFRSEPISSHRADAPVAMISAPSVSDRLAVGERHGERTILQVDLADMPLHHLGAESLRLARISVMRSGPMIPSRNPGQFSTIVVSIN